MPDHTPKSSFALVDGTRLHYLDWGGAGEPFILLHGVTSHCFSWVPFVHLTTLRYRFIALDQRGHGDSDKPAEGYASTDYAADLLRFTEALGLGPAVVLGSSMGGNTALVFAALYPEKAQALILDDPAIEIPQTVLEHQPQRWASRPASFASEAEALAFMQVNPVASKWTDERRLEYIWPNLRRDEAGRLVWKYSDEAVIQTYQGFRDDLWGFASQVRCPTLILQGEESDVFPAAVRNRLQQAIRGSQVRTFPRAGHLIHWDDLPGFEAVVRDFLHSL